MQATLALEDGQVYTGKGHGAQAEDSATALIRTLPDGLHINLAEGRKSSVAFRLPDGHVRVTYNESYRHANTDPRALGTAASYSLSLRPDVSIEVRRGSRRRRIFVDAKYDGGERYQARLDKVALMEKEMKA